MRILIISSFFPPFNSIGSVRVGKMAKYLSKFGHDVKVIAVKDLPCQTNLPLEISPKNVIFTNYIDFLQEFSKIKKFLNIFLIPTRTSNITENKNKTTTTTTNTNKIKVNIITLFVKKIKLLCITILCFPDNLLGWIPFALLAAYRLLKDWKPDVIYASGAPWTSLIIACLLSRHYKIPWIAELRDLWVDNHYYDFFYLRGRKKLEQNLERWVLSHAKALVTVSHPLADTLNKKYEKTVAVILNGFDKGEHPFVPDNLLRDSSIKIAYTGSIDSGLIQNFRNPDPLFKAIVSLGKTSEKVEVSFYGEGQDLVNKMAQINQIDHLVKTSERVSYQESLKIQVTADILLLLLWNDPTEKGVYTGKLFEYIGAGRPILAIGSADNVAADLIRERNAGVVLNDPVEIAEQLKKWIHQKETLGKIPALPSDVGIGLSREEQAKNLEKFLEQEIIQKK